MKEKAEEKVQEIFGDQEKINDVADVDTSAYKFVDVDQPSSLTMDMPGMREHRVIEMSDEGRPVYGVLTEPMRGDMRSKAQAESSATEKADTVTYIPKAHVQFLEQSGVRVVPISFLDSDEEIEAILDQVNGIYVPGDSNKALTNTRYQGAFSTILEYVESHNKDKDYFPMFLMGKSS